MFKNRIKCLLIAVSIGILLFLAMMFSIGSAGLGALPVLMILYGSGGLYLGGLLIIAYYIGYRLDIRESTVVIKINPIIELAGLILGTFLAGFLLNYLRLFAGRYGLVYNNSQGSIDSFRSILINWIPLISLIYVFIYSYIGFKLVRLVYFLIRRLKITKSDFLIPVYFLILTVPPPLFAFYRVNPVQEQETKIKSELKLTNFKEQTPMLKNRGTATEFVITADLYIPIEGKYDVISTLDGMGATFVDQSGGTGHQVNLAEGWQPVSFVSGSSYNCLEKGTFAERKQNESPARKRELRIEFRLQPQNTDFPPIYYETTKAYQENEFYLQCKT